MNLTQTIKTKLHDPLATFRGLERTIATVCILIPAVLRLTDTAPCPTDRFGFQSSISAYVYMPHSYMFGMMLCMAAMLFIFNGAVYFRNEDPHKLNLNPKGKWYNLTLGLTLLIIIILPCRDYVIPHYIFAGIFFLGNAFVIGFFHEPKNRTLSISLAMVTVASMIPWILGISSLFYSEWLSLIVIGIHFILEARR